jgi:hypothetical protein
MKIWQAFMRGEIALPPVDETDVEFFDEEE